MLEFLKEYKEVLVGGLAVLFTIISIIIKRRPKSIDDFNLCLNEILANIPELVASRERPGEGLAKKLEVEVSAQKLMEKRLGRSLSVQEACLVKGLIEDKIEKVLEAPQKKGV